MRRGAGRRQGKGAARCYPAGAGAQGSAAGAPRLTSLPPAPSLSASHDALGQSARTGPIRSMAQPRTLVVVSFYAARPWDRLHRLLGQLDEGVARAGFDIVVVVNSVGTGPMPLPPTKSPVSLLYRENTGMNIGAWEHGWRTLNRYDRYIFLQDECVVMRPDWPRAFTAALDNPATGIAGEFLTKLDVPWSALVQPPAEVVPGVRPRGNFWFSVLQNLREQGIEP